MNAIELRNVSVHQGGVPIISDVSVDIPRGSVTAIVGPNGAGKTTLLRAVLGLISFAGSVGFPTAGGNKRPSGEPRIGYVPQRLDFDRGMSLTVLDLFAVATQRRPVWLGISKKVEESARRYLSLVEAERLLYRPLGKLSGGELQRVQLALALECEPEIVLLDEPVAGVDVAGEHLFCDLLASIQVKAHLTLVMVSHDLSIVSQHATHVICLNRTLMGAGPIREVLTPTVLEKAFGPHTVVGDLEGLAGHHHHTPECRH